MLVYTTFTEPFFSMIIYFKFWSKLSKRWWCYTHCVPTQSWAQTRLGFRHWVPSRRQSPQRGTHWWRVVCGWRFFHLSPEIQLRFERTIKANCFWSQVEINLLRRLWRWLYKVEGDISLWTIAMHQVLQSVVDYRMISCMFVGCEGSRPRFNQ